TEVVVRAPPDGYTLLVFEASQAINATLYDKLNFVFLRDIAPIACIIRTPLVMEVHPSVPAKTVPEFIAYAKANPGKINMASAGTGTPAHLAGELFKVMTGVAMTHVPYRGGGSAITDLLGGQVQVFFSGVGTSIEYIGTGKVRALAVTTAVRLEALPDVPTVGDFVPGYEASTWYGVGAPSRPLQPIRKDLVIRFRRQRLAREAIMAAKEISVKKYVVRLSGEERERLETLLRKGKSPARRVLKARILLKADVSEAGKGWSDNRIIEALETSPSIGVVGMGSTPDELAAFLGAEMDKWGHVIKAANISAQ